MSDHGFSCINGYIYHKENIVCVIDLEGGYRNEGLYLWIMSHPERLPYDLTKKNRVKIIGVDLI